MGLLFVVEDKMESVIFPNFRRRLVRFCRLMWRWTLAARCAVEAQISSQQRMMRTMPSDALPSLSSHPPLLPKRRNAMLCPGQSNLRCLERSMCIVRPNAETTCSRPLVVESPRECMIVVFCVALVHELDMSFGLGCFGCVSLLELLFCGLL